ncbi:zinc finger CCHC domain-containing protein 18-like [Tachysurus ichikawai]
MSDSDERPEESVQVPDVGAVVNDVLEQIKGQIQDLNDWRNDTLANRAAGGGNTTRSYLYVPRERQVQPFIGEYNKDGRQEFAGEPGPDPDADWDDCVAICGVIRRGTTLEPELALKGVECSRLRQIRALEAGEDAITHNTHTLPGYTREQVVEFQKSDPVLQVF